MPPTMGTQSFVLFDETDLYAEVLNEKRRHERRRALREQYDSKEARARKRSMRKARQSVRR